MDYNILKKFFATHLHRHPELATQAELDARSIWPVHDHDERYYTEDELDPLLAEKALNLRFKFSLAKDTVWSIAFVSLYAVQSINIWIAASEERFWSGFARVASLQMIHRHNTIWQNLGAAGALTGTTGADGKFNMSVGVNSFWLENRHADSPISFSVNLMLGEE